jgi:hypothetical protein
VALNVLVADRIRRIFLGLVDSSINCDLFLDLKKYPEAELLLRFVRYRRCDRP